MSILAIDTVTEMCSVAVSNNDEVFSISELVKQRHTETVLPMVQQVLEQAGLSLAQITTLAFDRGPGSFTGLRVGAGVVQGLALAQDIPVIPVSSLAVLAQGAYRQNQQAQVLACMDARRNEVYWACYELHNGLMAAVGEEYVTGADLVATPAQSPWYGIGTGFASYYDELSQNCQVNVTDYDAMRYPLAEDMLPLAQAAWEAGNSIAPNEAIPIYLRDDVTHSVKHN